MLQEDWTGLFINSLAVSFKLPPEIFENKTLNFPLPSILFDNDFSQICLINSLYFDSIVLIFTIPLFNFTQSVSMSLT